MQIEIKEMMISDYHEAMSLWQQTEGMCLRVADSREGIEAYLRRNPGLSFVARSNGQLIGTVLCGHDGRRGYLHHLAVAHEHRGQGVGKKLTEQVIAALQQNGIQKCHLFVLNENTKAIQYWQKRGWQHRHDIRMMSFVSSDDTHV
ncbi:MAG: N-acetyltransferase [Nitrospirales bacterium]|nr:MAG: N-acetyltransferase [Nitrospirales bacterium]